MSSTNKKVSWSKFCIFFKKKELKIIKTKKNEFEKKQKLILLENSNRETKLTNFT